MSVEIRKTNEEFLDTEENKTAQPNKLLQVCSDMALEHPGKDKVSTIPIIILENYLSFLLTRNIMVCCSRRFDFTNPVISFLLKSFTPN